MKPKEKVSYLLEKRAERNLKLLDEEGLVAGYKKGEMLFLSDEGHAMIGDWLKVRTIREPAKSLIMGMDAEGERMLGIFEYFLSHWDGKKVECQCENCRPKEGLDE